MKRRFSKTDNGYLCQALFFTALLAVIVTAGCSESVGDSAELVRSASRQPVGANGEAVSAGDAARDKPVTVTDQLDRVVSFTAPPQRIVSLSPSITEILFAIGAGDRLVGATKYCDHPPAALDIPRIGGGTLESINQELIVALEPDLVLCKADTHEPLLRNLERLGIPLLGLGPETFAELYDHTELLGRITGQSSEAEVFVERMQQRIAAVTERIPAGDGPVVFYQVWDDPLMTAGPRSYIGELLGLAGARSLFEETNISYPKVTAEVVIAGDPDVILAPGMHATPVTVEGLLSRPGWSQVRAVQDRRVYVIDRDPISRCGPRLVDALEEIAAVLYPNRFPPSANSSEANGAAGAGDAAGREDSSP